MEILTALLEAHWQLILLKGGLDWKMEWNKLLVCLQESCQCFHSIFYSVFQSSPPFSNTSYYKLSVCLQESCQCFHSIFRSVFHSIFQSSRPFSNTPDMFNLTSSLLKYVNVFSLSRLISSVVILSWFTL